MNNLNKLITTVLIFALYSCGTLRKSPKMEFTDGFYSHKTNGNKQIVYLKIEEDTLRIYPAKKVNNQKTIDTTVSYWKYQKEISSDLSRSIVLSKPSFDLDFLTMPLKYRPAQSQVPAQLNTNLNGAIYLGYRTDKFKISYISNPLNKSYRIINHFGFSIGGFAGLGNTAMTPTTTNNKLAIEYDGVVWIKGIAGIIAINNFTLGLSVGFDNLQDKNKNIWIYESKPWYGLAFGLNLN